MERGLWSCVVCVGSGISELMGWGLFDDLVG
jgi:hypothetical protein